MVSYKERLAAALKAAQVSDSQLARHLGVSIQAVRKVAAGTTSAFTAENNAKAAQFLRVSPDWLATGDGDMRPATTWPFVLLTSKQALSLNRQNRDIVENLALRLLDAQSSTVASDRSDTENGSPRVQGLPVARKPIPVKRVKFTTPGVEEDRDRAKRSKPGGVRSGKG